MISQELIEVDEAKLEELIAHVEYRDVQEPSLQGQKAQCKNSDCGANHQRVRKRGKI